MSIPLPVQRFSVPLDVAEVEQSLRELAVKMPVLRFFGDQTNGGAEVGIPNTHAVQTVLHTDGTTEVRFDAGALADRPTVVMLWGTLNVRADSANWTPIVGRIGVFDVTGGANTNTDNFDTNTFHNQGAASGGNTTYSSVSMVGWKVVPAGKTYRFRLQTYIANGAFGGLYERAAGDGGVLTGLGLVF